jgi:hypothetical protein
MVERRSLQESNFSLSPKEGDFMSSQQPTSPRALESLPKGKEALDLLAFKGERAILYLLENGPRAEMLLRVNVAIHYSSKGLGLIQYLSEEERKAIEEFIDKGIPLPPDWNPAGDDKLEIFHQACRKLYDLAALKQQTEGKKWEEKYRRALETVGVPLARRLGLVE